jgi:hypothetical protein
MIKNVILLYLTLALKFSAISEDWKLPFIPIMKNLMAIKSHSGRFLLKIGINSKNAKFELTASYISIQESII